MEIKVWKQARQTRQMRVQVQVAGLQSTGKIPPNFINRGIISKIKWCLLMFNMGPDLAIYFLFKIKEV